MMNNRSMIYMVFAIALGYLIVSTVPVQLESLLSPQMSLRGEQEMLSPVKPRDAVPPTSERELEEGSDVLSASEDASKEIESDTETGLEEYSNTTSIRQDENLLFLFMWWTVDLSIALGIYFITRRLLS
jgi:hypothetical protein